MTPLMDQIKTKAKHLKRHIVLPDSLDERAIKAARICVDQRLAEISLVGNERDIRSKAAQLDVNLDGIHVVDPEQSAKLQSYANTYFDLRKAKGMQPDVALQTMKRQARSTLQEGKAPEPDRRGSSASRGTRPGKWS